MTSETPNLAAELAAAEEQRDRYRTQLEATRAQLAVEVGRRDNAAFRAATHADTLMHVLGLLDSNKNPAALGPAIRAVILRGRSAIVERKPPAPRPAAVTPVAFAPIHFHIGLSRLGNEIEQNCPCPLVPCGLVLDADADPACPHHGRWADMDKLILQIHPAESCPAVAARPTPAGV